jgi:hypothetical protein
VEDELGPFYCAGGKKVLLLFFRAKRVAEPFLALFNGVRRLPSSGEMR